MRKLLLTAALGLLFAGSALAQTVKVTIKNPSKFDRIGEIVEIPVSAISSRLPEIKDGETIMVQHTDGAVVVSQITKSGHLIFRADVPVKKTATYLISVRPVMTYAAMTYARFVPERMDDLAWENDRVAFRVYGPALVKSDGPSNGIDLWYKRTSDLYVDYMYDIALNQKKSYHEDYGKGLDDYKVGRSLGAGAMAPFLNNKLYLNGNFTSYRIIENGPLRTTIELTYPDMDVDGMRIADTKTISIDAGSQFSKITQNYNGDYKHLPVAVGIVKRPGDNAYLLQDDYFIYLEPKTPKVSGVYVAVVMPAGIEKHVTHSYEIAKGEKGAGPYEHNLLLTDCMNSEPVTYYLGYGWEKHGFENIDKFGAYVRNFNSKLKAPLIVKCK